MISHLADSDALIDHLKGREPVLSFLAPPIRASALAVSPITVGEVYEGILGGSEPRFRRDFDELLGSLTVVDITRDTALRSLNCVSICGGRDN